MPLPVPQIIQVKEIIEIFGNVKLEAKPLQVMKQVKQSQAKEENSHEMDLKNFPIVIMVRLLMCNNC